MYTYKNVKLFISFTTHRLYKILVLYIIFYYHHIFELALIYYLKIDSIC